MDAHPPRYAEPRSTGHKDDSASVGVMATAVISAF